MAMTKYIIRRIIQGVFLFFGAITLCFIIIQLAPGSYESQFINPQMTPEDRQRIIELYHLDRPLPEQYLFYMVNLFQGNLGTSFKYREPVLDVIIEKAGNTIFLALASLAMSIIIAIPLGIISGMKPYSKLDNFNTVFSLVGFSLPAFWLGLMLMIVFSTPQVFGFALLPLAGMNSTGVIYRAFSPEWLIDRIQHMILPTFVLGFGGFAMILRLTRASMIEVLSQDYIRTARAKGIKERTVVYKHGFRNARLSIVTIVGLNIAFLLGGAVLTESVFAWPGMGRLTFFAILQRDYPLLMGNYVITALLVIVMNLLTDLTYAWLDPRIQFN